MARHYAVHDLAKAGEAPRSILDQRARDVGATDHVAPHRAR
jgi:hypothetical protein